MASAFSLADSFFGSGSDGGVDVVEGVGSVVVDVGSVDDSVVVLVGSDASMVDCSSWCFCSRVLNLASHSFSALKRVLSKMEKE